MQHHKYGKGSSSKLLTCHVDMRRIAHRGLARSPYDITIIHGFRGRTLQNRLYAKKASKVPWPLSKHNNEYYDDVLEEDIPLSLAIDFGPYVKGIIPWEDTHIFAHIAGVFMSVADEMDIELIWGGDFDGDGSSKDQTLLDWGHIHIVPK